MTWNLCLRCLRRLLQEIYPKQSQPEGFAENQAVARRSGNVAGIARKALEAETGKPVITSQNAADFARLVGEIVEDPDGNAGAATTLEEFPFVVAGEDSCQVLIASRNRETGKQVLFSPDEEWLKNSRAD